MSKIKNGGLDQYGAEPFEKQQFGTSGTEGVENTNHIYTAFYIAVVLTESFQMPQLLQRRMLNRRYHQVHMANSSSRVGCTISYSVCRQ